MNPNKAVLKLGVVMALLTLATLSCSGVSDLPNLFATETPTPTDTFTPSPTITPSPTSTLTPTPTPVPTGTNVEKQSDGSIRLIDYDNKFNLTLPADWLVIPFNQSSYADAMDQLTKDNPQLAAAAKAFKNMDPEMFRLVAINTNSKYLKNTFASNLNITAYENELMGSMPLEFLTGALEQQFTKNGAKVLTHDVNTIENSHGIDIEFIEIEQTANKVTFQQRIIVFQSNQKLVMIALTTLPEFSKDVFAEGNIIGASIEALK